MDIKTLFIYISISAICVLGLSVYVYWKHTRFTRGSFYWLAAILAISASSILFALTDETVSIPPYFPIGLANSLLLFSPALMSISFRLLYDKAKLWIPLVSFFIAAAIFNITMPITIVNERIIVFSVLFGLLWLDPALLTLRKPHRRHSLLLGISFLFVSLASFVRAILYEKDIPSLLQGGIVQQVYIIAMGLEMFLFLAGYILMLNSQNLERIKANEATLRAAIDNSPYGMVITDETGQVQSVNSTFERISGYSQAEVQEQGLPLAHSAEGEKPETQREIWETLRRDKNWHGELHGQRKDGVRFWEKAIWSPIKTDQDKITGFFGVTRDITHDKQLEDFKNEIEHLMRHDLKTPLNAIINLPDLIRQAGELSREQEELLQTIQQSGDDMLEQINGSLELYKLEEGSYQGHYQRTDLREILVSFDKVFLPLVQSHQVTLDYSFQADDLANLDKALILQTDRNLLRRLIGNLLKNAIEAAPIKTVVRIQAALNPHTLTVSIHNEGAIPESIRERFFAKFNTFGKPNGTGLGAYSSKIIADFLGYGLTFSTSEETGTVLFLKIPII